ncbi:MAG: hypothetical protein ACQEQV_10965, partial [Fibrobacterota bacterium]
TSNFLKELQTSLKEPQTCPKEIQPILFKFHGGIFSRDNGGTGGCFQIIALPKEEVCPYERGGTYFGVQD